jgi:hypothetical protein
MVLVVVPTAIAVTSMLHPEKRATLRRAIHPLVSHCRYAPEVRRLAAQHPQVWIFYSETSLSVDATHPSTLLGVYALLHDLGVAVGFATEALLASGAVGKDVDGGAVLVVPTGATCVSDTAAAIIGELAVANNSRSGGAVVVVGTASQLSSTLDRGLGCAPVSSQEAERRSWVHQLARFVPVDGGGNVSGPAELARLEKALAPRLRRSLRCVGPDGSPILGLFWRAAPASADDGSVNVLVINLANTTASVTLAPAEGAVASVTDVRTGVEVTTPLRADPLGVHLLSVRLK